jgi:hypothetical protein
LGAWRRLVPVAGWSAEMELGSVEEPCSLSVMENGAAAENAA